jgi:hypothetical protein
MTPRKFLVFGARSSREGAKEAITIKGMAIQKTIGMPTHKIRGATTSFTNDQNLSPAENHWDISLSKLCPQRDPKLNTFDIDGDAAGLS